MTASLRRRLWRLAALAVAVSLAGCSAVNPYYDPARSHHRPDGFANNHGPRGGKSFADFVRWQYQRMRDGLPPPPSRFVDGYAFPLERPDLALLHAARGPQSPATLTWIGHATLLLQVGGLNVLTDPHFSERASPLSWAGPRRRTPLPARLDELPRIDVVLITHNHYDHLDAPTVRMLAAQPGGAPRFLVPLGVDLWLRDAGIDTVQRLDWWDSTVIDGVEFHLTPVQHWSQRTPLDRNLTLWGGWVVRRPGFSFFFSGDTGYSPDFADIGARFEGFDLAAIPVGAYEPRWFMKEQHVNPEEAVRIHLDLRARRSIGVHWGTFELTDEPLDQPIGDLADALERLDLPSAAFRLLRHGQTIVIE